MRAQGIKTRGVYDAINDDAPAFMHQNFSATKECHLAERLFGCRAAL